MCTKNINIGEAELEIMKVIWKAEGPIGSAEIGKAVEARGWKRTTVATFLAHLVEKGALSAEKRGKSCYYTACLTAAEYKKSRLQSLVKNVFDGSARDMIASLFDERVLSDEDISELKAMFGKEE